MGLLEYFKKRDLNKTPEPGAGKKSRETQLRFVVQEHHASHLHYDFRLELDGVLKSWAIPKGPSLDPKVKRLAMMVEDHPFDYRNFEGIIPEGQYGAGEVIVWDKGFYKPLGEFDDRKSQEKELRRQLKTGALKFTLHGQKLKGDFAMVKTPAMGKNAWLLIKHEDKYATNNDITEEDMSVLSGETLESIAAKGGTNHSRSGKQVRKSRKKSAVNADPPSPGAEADIKSTLDTLSGDEMPRNIKPMLATLVDAPFDNAGWQYEVKWDGYRTLAYINNGQITLQSRNLKSFDERFFPIARLMKTWKINALIDGEIVVLNSQGISDFEALQNWRKESDGELVYFVFDLLWYDGKNLMKLPLEQRQSILNHILPAEDDHIRLSKTFRTGGKAFFQSAEKIGLEGIMAKKIDSTYHPDYRSREWLKIKTHGRQEVIIGGYTKKDASPKVFSSLLLGVYENGKLRYSGKVGTGFSESEQKEMMKLFHPLEIPESPFLNPPREKATWLKPELVCEIAYGEVTREGLFRQPAFKGMRVDKDPAEVKMETPAEAGKAIRTAQEEQANSGVPEIGNRKTSNAPGLFPDNSVDELVTKIKGRQLKFTHLNKVFWPDEGITKRDVLDYYHHVAEYILPYLKNRPLSLNRFPNGISGSSFFQKDVKGTAPEWADTYPYISEGEHKEYLVGSDEASLLWMVSLGCIEINPWFSKVDSPDHPDYCVIDLDPDKSNTFDQVITAALEVKKVLDIAGVPSFPKTSGSTGIHIYTPLHAKYSYDQSQMFAKIIVEEVHRRIPDFTTLERMVAKRGNKMYLDFLQNRPAATIAGPYSLRPKPGATVSMPLHWDEVKSGLRMKDFTMFNTIGRLQETGDLFKGVLGNGIDMKTALKKLKETP